MPFRLRHLTHGLVHSRNGNTRVLGIKIGQDLAPAVKPIIMAAAVATANPGLAAAATAIVTSAVVDHSLGVSDKDVFKGAVIASVMPTDPIAAAGVKIAIGQDPASAVIGACIDVGTEGGIVAEAVKGATIAAVTGDNMLRAALQGAAIKAATEQILVDALEEPSPAKADALEEPSPAKADALEEPSPAKADALEEPVSTGSVDSAPRISIPTTLVAKIPLNDVANFVAKPTAAGIEIKIGETTHGALFCESLYPGGACARYENRRGMDTPHEVADIGFIKHETTHVSNGCLTLKSDKGVSTMSGHLSATHGVELHMSAPCVATPVLAGLATAAIVAGPEIVGGALLVQKALAN